MSHAALHVVLAAQRVHADAFAADVAGGHREVGDAHHHRRALRVLGDAEAVVDRAVGPALAELASTLPVANRRAAPRISAAHAGHCLDRFGRVLGPRDEFAPFAEALVVAALGDVLLGQQAFGHDHVRQRGDHRDVGAGPQRQVEVGLDVRRVDQVDPARIDDDQLRALAQALASCARRTPGAPSVGLAPITMITSDFSTDLKVCVPADSPSVWLRP